MIGKALLEKEINFYLDDPKHDRNIKSNLRARHFPSILSCKIKDLIL